jgi:hypothetical protein
MDENVGNPIPLEIAIQLCDEIREELDRIWYPTPARVCLCCEQEGCEDPTKRGFTRLAGNRGCTLVNARYAEMTHKKSAV